MSKYKSLTARVPFDEYDYYKRESSIPFAIFLREALHKETIRLRNKKNRERREYLEEEARLTGEC